MTDAPVILQVEGVLFDMDGVLVSSIGSVTRCWRRWAEHYGVAGADTYEVPHGVRAVDIMRQLVPGIDEVEGLRLIEDLELDDVADLRVLPGARDLLESLPEDRWAIVTSATRRLLVGRLEAAGLPVPGRIISADVVERGKPDPEPYRRGAALIHAAPEACLVVEDAPSGVQAGVAAQCRVLGVEGTHRAIQLQQAGALAVVPSLERVRAETADEGLRISLLSLA